LRTNAPLPSRTIALNPIVDRSYHYWHVFVAGLSFTSEDLLGIRIPVWPPADEAPTAA
jgi:hypothetical protein